MTYNNVKDISDLIYGKKFWAKVVKVPISQLRRLTAQVDIDAEWVEEINSNFNSDLFMPLRLGKIKGTKGSYIVIDGHHRWSVCVAKGLRFVYAYIIPIEDMDEAHELFEKYNKAQRTKSPYTYHRNALAMNKPEAVELQDAADEFGFELVKPKGPANRNQIKAVGGLQEFQQMAGIDMLKTAMMINRRAFNGTAGSLSSVFWYSMRVFLTHMTKTDPSWNMDHFISKLKEVNAVNLMEALDITPNGYQPITWIRRVYYLIQFESEEAIWKEIEERMQPGQEEKDY